MRTETASRRAEGPRRRRRQSLRLPEVLRPLAAQPFRPPRYSRRPQSQTLTTGKEFPADRQRGPVQGRIVAYGPNNGADGVCAVSPTDAGYGGSPFAVGLIWHLPDAESGARVNREEQRGSQSGRESCRRSEGRRTHLLRRALTSTLPTGEKAEVSELDGFQFRVTEGAGPTPP